LNNLAVKNFPMEKRVTKNLINQFDFINFSIHTFNYNFIEDKNIRCVRNADVKPFLHEHGLLMLQKYFSMQNILKNLVYDNAKEEENVQ
jgi:hypothetical protein